MPRPHAHRQIPFGDGPPPTTRDLRERRLREGRGVWVINLGCARNLVDAQALLGRLRRRGFVVGRRERAEIVVVNTCSFIEEAKKESIDTILDVLDLKRRGVVRKVIVAGCLAQRYGRELAEELDGVDAIVGVERLGSGEGAESVYLTPRHYGYLKICESCYNRCAFCAIPSIKGKFVSRRMEDVLKEASALEARGAREINIIGQDITAYGMDLWREKRLAELLRRLCRRLDGVRWIRLLYAFPAHVTDDLIAAVAEEAKICPYIDLPLQHISDRLLARMNRGITTAGTRALLRRIRDRIPGARLRTTFIVGLPGETEEDFRELCRFVEEARFERMGAFIYSREEGTPAAAMPDQVPDEEKRRRLDVLMRLQQGVSRSLQEDWVGRILPVMIDEPAPDRDNVFIGRTAYDAPEVDGVVYVSSPHPLEAGTFVDVRLTDALEYDWVGDVVRGPSDSLKEP